MEIKILYEDENILALNKPAGLLVHGIFDKHGPKHNEETLTDWLLKNYPEVSTVGDQPEQRPGIVHRLDRETSGVMLVAKTQKAFEYLKHLFQSKEIEKKYLALVWGKTDLTGVVDKAISIKDGSVKRTVFKGKAPREAMTSYKSVKFLRSKEGSEYSLIELSPKTGRTHQIRVHMSSIGHSVVGDKLYGKKSSPTGLGRQFLHASEISFKNLDGKDLNLKVELSSDLESFLKTLVEDPSDGESCDN